MKFEPSQSGLSQSIYHTIDSVFETRRRKHIERYSKDFIDMMFTNYTEFIGHSPILQELHLALTTQASPITAYSTLGELIEGIEDVVRQSDKPQKTLVTDVDGAIRPYVIRNFFWPLREYFDKKNIFHVKEVIAKVYQPEFDESGFSRAILYSARSNQTFYKDNGFEINYSGLHKIYFSNTNLINSLLEDLVNNKLLVIIGSSTFDRVLLEQLWFSTLDYIIRKDIPTDEATTLLQNIHYFGRGRNLF
jgi:hypothetical protein